MRSSIIAIGAVLVAVATGSSARADCTCRGPGVVAHHGQTVCLRTPTGPRLARCEMVLNNASWTFLPEPCPEASFRSDRVDVAARVSPLPDDQPVFR